MSEGFRFFKLRNSSGNIIWRFILNRDGDQDSPVWQDEGNKVQANDSKWTDLATETNGDIKDKEWYKFGAHVIGPMPNEWSSLHQVDLTSNKMATFTYTTSGISFDGLSDKD